MDYEEMLRSFENQQRVRQGWHPVTDKVYKQCIEDAIKHFAQSGILIRTTAQRVRLTEKQQQDVLQYLKERMDYYDSTK